MASTNDKSTASAIAQRWALRTLLVIGERWPATRHLRTESQILDELNILAWAIDEAHQEFESQTLKGGR